MLCTDSMPRSHNSALEKRKRRFYRVHVNIAVHVDPRFMFDRLVPMRESNLLHDRRVGVEFIGYDYVNVGAHVFADVFRQFRL